MIDGFDITSIESIREQFIAWLGMGRFFGKVSIDSEATGQGIVYYGDRFRLTVETALEFQPAVLLHIWTEKRSYSIVGKPQRRDEGDELRRSYLGCTMSNRAPRAGEDWTRGSDLHDGQFTEAGWLAILTDIAGFEAQPVHVPTKGQTIPA